MAQSYEPDFEEVYPPWEALARTSRHPMLTDSARRLTWTLQGPLATSVFVSAGPNDAKGPRESYVLETTSGPVWHTVSLEPLTRPRISSLSVKVRQLDYWADDWEEWHRHAEPGDSRCEFRDAALVTGDADDDPRLVYCCGETRPPIHTPLRIKARKDLGYITIHDYVSAVHPWLLELRQDMLRALNFLEDPRPLPAETRLYVDFYAPESLRILHES